MAARQDLGSQVYIRGNAWDYDHWASLGNEGWSYKDVLPYFRKTENYEPGVNEFHGVNGELNIAELRSTNPLSHAFVKAAQQAGYALNNDFNGAVQGGVGFYKVFQKDGERCSNARAFLRPAEGRKNLTVITEALATRILFEGKHAIGVRYVNKRGVYHDVHAAQEVILSGGTVNSPQLLLLSGVGPEQELIRHNITTVHDLPGVGKNLQDHLDAFVTIKEKTRFSISMNPMSFFKTLVSLFQYLFGKRGELTSNVAESGGFIKTRPEEPIPDLQLHFVPVPNSAHAQNLKPFLGYAYSLMAYDVRPLSRGEITLKNNNPLEYPKIEANYFSHPRDVEKMVIAIKKVREILNQPAFASHAKEEEIPGPNVQTDEQIADWLREKTETLYHPVGTCKMGTDPMAVVDPQLRVHGIVGLRVIDASVMPTLIGGNTNAPTTMIAEKGAAMILQDAPRG